MARCAFRLSLLGAVMLALVVGSPAQGAPRSRSRIVQSKDTTARARQRRQRRARRLTAPRTRNLGRRLRPAQKPKPQIAKLLRKATTLALDLDNTVVDTRPRTVAAVHTFARNYGGKLPKGMRASLRRIGKDQVGYDWQETAQKLGLPKAARDHFRRTWTGIFWNPRSLRLDEPVPTTIALIRQAQKQGKRIVFVTGRRINPFQAATVEQLQKLGLIDSNTDNVFLKPGGNTAAFKTQLIKSWVARGERVVLIDDSTVNVKVLDKANIAGAHAVAVGFPVNDPSGPQLEAHIPVLAVQP